MRTAINWLDEVVILNESRNENVAGDVSIYRSEGDALGWIEGWWVEDSEGFAFSATGVRLVLEVSDGVVFVARREECDDGLAIVLNCLQSLGQTTLKARNRVAQDGRIVLSEAEKAGALPTTVEGLIAYIGFPWVAPRNWFIPGCLLLLTAIAMLLIFTVVRLF